MIPLSPHTRAEVREALQAVVDHAQDAYAADELDAIKRQLDETWHAVRYAREVVTTAEQETRAGLLAALETEHERKVA